MTVKSLLISGNFEESDLQELTALFRTIERRQPRHRFLFAIIEADLSMADAKRMLERIFPRIEDDEPTFQTIPRTLKVVCPDGVTRIMTSDLNVTGFTPDIEQSRLMMMQGSVEIDGHIKRGEAWFQEEDAMYHFVLK